MATVTEPIALDKSLNTTEVSPRNLADVLAEGIGDLVSAISQIAPQTTYDELDKLNDVQITSVTSGQVLKWNGSKWVNANESGGSGGHTIEDSTGTALTQRTNLQFKDLSVTDDSVNDATVVSASGKADKADLTSISETGSTASQAISAGQYFYLNGSLVRAKTDIASGATFVSGTNYESGDNALNSYLAGTVVTQQYTSSNHTITLFYEPKEILYAFCGDQSSYIMCVPFVDHNQRTRLKLFNYAGSDPLYCPDGTYTITFAYR